MAPQAIGAAVAAALIEAGASAAVAAAASAIAAFAVTTSISVGLSLAANLIFRPGGQAASNKPSDGQQAIKQAIPARWKSYGTVRIAGPVWWMAADAANGRLHLGQALNQGRIDSIVSYHLDDAEVVIDVDGDVTSSPYSGAYTRILTRLGLPTETKYSEINTSFTVDEVRGDGVATVLGVFDNFATAELQFQNYPNGVPRLRLTINASVVWDPRDAAQDREDETTWEWSENPVVCLLNYLLDDDGFAIPWARIEGNLDQWIEAMNICDEQVASISAGGYENRYRMAGSYFFTARPADVVARFLSTCDGRCWQKRDGTIGIVVGKYSLPACRIQDKDVLSYELTRGQDPLTAVAGIRAQYLSPENDYREQDAEPWPDGNTVSELGEERVASLDLTWVPSFSQARRIMKRQALREAADWRGTIRTTLAGLRAIDERFIKLTVSELGIDEVSFEVGKFTIDLARLECTIEVLSVGPEIDDFDPATEEGTPASTPVLIAWNGSFMNGDGSPPNYPGISSYRSAVAPTAAGAQCRFTFQSQWALPFSHVSIVQRSGSTDDGTTTPTEITFSGGTSGFNIAANTTVTSDWMDYAIAVGTEYLITLDTNDEPAAYHSGGTDSAYEISGASWNVQTVTGTLKANRTYFLTQIEVRASA